MLIASQCAASNLLRWLCTRWCVASVSSHVPLSAARRTTWALIRVIRSARLHGFVTWSLSPPLVLATNDRPAVHRWCSNQGQSYSCTCSTTARAQATLDVFRCASPAHTHGRTVAMAISILAARDLSLASISSKVSDDSLSRQSTGSTYWLLCLSNSPHIHGWPAGGAGAATRARRVWCNGYWPAGAAACDEFGARQCGEHIRLLPLEINWAHRMLSQSSASILLRWSCAHWLKRAASVLSDIPLSVATLWAESWALIGVLHSAQHWHVSLTWLLSPPLARATNDRPAVMFQPSDSYTCITIPLEHRLY